MLICPNCHGKLKEKLEQYECKSCNSSFKIENNVGFLYNPQLKNVSDQLFEYDFYKAMLQGKITERYFHKKRVNAIFDSISDEFKKKKILEVGCGTGAILIPLAQKNADITGIDLATDAVKKCRAYCTQLNLNTSLFIADANNLPFIENYFDIIILPDIIEHIEDLSRVLNEVSRVSKNQAKIIITGPWQKHPKSIKWIRKLLTGRPKEHIDKHTDFEFNIKTLEKNFNASLQYKKIFYFIGWMVTVWKIQK